MEKMKLDKAIEILLSEKEKLSSSDKENNKDIIDAIDSVMYYLKRQEFTIKNFNDSGNSPYINGKCVMCKYSSDNMICYYDKYDIQKCSNVKECDVFKMGDFDKVRNLLYGKYTD